MDSTVEWVKAVTAILGVGLLPVLSWLLTRSFERTRGDLSRVLQDGLDRDRREASQELQLLKSWMGEELQRRLDAERSKAHGDFDRLRVDVVRAGRQVGVNERRAEVAADTLMAVLEYLDALRRTEWDIPKPDERSNHPGRDDFRAEIRRRWDEVDSHEPALRKAMVKSTVYLPDDVEDLVRKVARLKMRMSFKVQRWLRSFHGNLAALPVDSSGMLLEVPWPRLGDEIRPLEEEARALLRPIARMESTAADR
jgi:hypothetical protein